MCEFCNDDLNLRHSFICTKLNIKPESKVKIEVEEEKKEKIYKTENKSIGK